MKDYELEETNIRDYFGLLEEYVNAVDYLSVHLDAVSDASAGCTAEYMALYYAMRSTILRLHHLIKDAALIRDPIAE